MQSLARWSRNRAAGYMRNKGVVWGANAEVFQSSAVAPGKFALYADVVKHANAPWIVDVCGDHLGVLSDHSFQWAFVGPRLATVPDPETRLREISRKLEVGGHLVVFVPLAAEAPANYFVPESIPQVLEQFGCWQAKDSYIQEKHTLQVYKKLRGQKGIRPSKPRAAKRACVCRYGAIGDMVMVTPLIQALAEDGYEVTVNCTDYSAAVLENNPHVTNIIYQERDVIPNPELGEYWALWGTSYDKYINLSESIEGTLLKVEGRRDFYMPKQWRAEKCDKNYLDFTMQLGGYPDRVGAITRLYFTPLEQRICQKVRDQHRDKFLVLWALNGSSRHKIYGLFEPVVADWLDSHPDARVITVGDEMARLLEFEHPQLVPAAGKWPLRQSLGMTQPAYVDLVVGPETAMLNAAACFSTPKICLLSHSSRENLTKYWTNDFSLEPNQAVAACYPCHQLHYDRPFLSCPQSEIVNDETGEVLSSGPTCAMGAIEGERLTAQLNHVYALWAANR